MKIYNVLAIAFGASIFFTWLAINVAKRFRIFDYPDRGRKIHSRPMPLLGGVAIFGAYAFALLLNFHFSWELKGVVIASFILMLSGLVDDLRGLPAFARLVMQILCSLLVIGFGVRLNIVPDNLPFSCLIEVVITVIWIVGIINALNFLDGVDGLATGIAVIASGTFCIIAYQTGQQYFAFLNIALAGACLGFLVFNFPPAKIFLGDSGSSFLGFSLAALAAMGEWAEKNPIVALSIPLLILAILIFDMVYISISRIARRKVRTFKQWIDHVDKDHLHHRLLAMGFSPRQTILVIYMVNMVFALAALVLKKATTFQAILLLAQAVLVLAVLTMLMLVIRRHMDESRFYEKQLKEIADKK